MPTITLKGVPLKLYRELKKQATAERRSLNAEAIRRLEESVAVPDDPARDPEAFLARVREQRAQYNTPLVSGETIERYIRLGQK